MVSYLGGNLSSQKTSLASFPCPRTFPLDGTVLCQLLGRLVSVLELVPAWTAERASGRADGSVFFPPGR